VGSLGHHETRHNRDEGSCNLGNMGFFAPAALRMTLVMNVMLNPDLLETKDLVFSLCHPESRQSRDEGSCNLGNMGFFAPAALRMTVVMNVILNPDKVGMKDLVFILTKIDSSSPDLVGVLRMTAKKVIPRACGAQNDSGDERHTESRFLWGRSIPSFSN